MGLGSPIVFVVAAAIIGTPEQGRGEGYDALAVGLSIGLVLVLPRWCNALN